MQGRPRPLRLVSRKPVPAADSLEILMSRVARGDDTAFEQLYRRLAPAVFGLVRRVLRDPAQSEEVAQEVLVLVWRRAARYNPARGSVQAWVMTIAHRRAVDRVRAEHAAAYRERIAAWRDHQSSFDEVVEASETRLERQAVRRCLEALTVTQRESVTLTYYQGYTYREAAELLDAPLGTVKTRIRDGLIRLRDCLGATR